MKKILTNFIIVFVAFNLSACGQTVGNTTADVSVPSAVAESDSASVYMEGKAPSEAEEIPSAESNPEPSPNPNPTYVEPAPSDDATAESNIYSEYIDDWYAEISGAGNTTDDAVSDSSIYAEYFDEWYREQREAANAGGDSTKITITSDSIIPSGIGYLVTAYDFTKSMKTGSSVVISDNQSSSFPYEGRYGIDAYVSGTTLYVKAYSNMGYDPDIESAIIKIPDGRTVDVNDINYSSYTGINMRNYSGTCRLTTTFEYKGFSVSNKLNIFVNGDEIWLCKLTSKDTDDFASRRALIDKITDDIDITPENSLGIDEIMYPVTDGDRFRRDTDRWAELSETIITDDSWTDEYKVVLIHDWIVNNIAYDSYRQYNLNKPRDYYNKDWSGTYSVYNTHTGVCFDLSHIFLIMCRYNGIPCITLENNEHMWNGVWLDGHWQELDLCDDVNRFTDTADTSVVNTSSPPGYGSLDDTSVPELIYVNRTLWTYECVWGSGINYGWYYN